MLLLLLPTAAPASDGTREVSLEEIVQSAQLIAIVQAADPMNARPTIQVPLPVTPPRTMEWSEGVATYTVVEALRSPKGVEVPSVLTAIGPRSKMNFDRTVIYEAEGRSKGIIHHRYKGSLDPKNTLDGETFIVFFRTPSPKEPNSPHDVAWTEAFGQHWVALGRDALSARKGITKEIQKDDRPE